MVERFTPLIPLLPLAAFLFFVLGACVKSWTGRGTRLPDRTAYLSVALMGASFLLSLLVAYDVLIARGGAAFYHSYPWLVIGHVNINFGFMVDPLSAVMLVVVSSVAFAVQVYSLGYMEGDERYPRFFSYLSLFTSAMLGLVLANSLLQLFIAWEIMGLASYLLIGFWFQKESAMRAAKKAFVVTRVGDTFLFLGMLWLVAATGTTDFRDLVLGVPAGGFMAADGSDAAITGGALLFAKGLVGSTTLGWIALLIFGGAVGKSAQIGLHVWLPDAMEGPTPVSALIHAATMVAAGVYLVARMYPLFDLAAPLTVLGLEFRVLGLVALVGVLTALMAAYIALTQNDIKRVLAYSTCSQLGFMFIALGSGGTVVGADGARMFLSYGFAGAMFHLMTHAFFKALLFLGAGSVIHGAGTQDIWRMGGLRRYMPVTFATFIIGTLALAGFPLLSGFWSKDMVLEAAWQFNPLILAGALLGAGMTAFYMTRLCIVTFFGEWSGGEPGAGHGHGDAPGHHEPHESPKVMLAPLAVLAVLAVCAGWVGLPWANQFKDLVKYEPPHAWWQPSELRVGSGEPAELGVRSWELGVAGGAAASGIEMPAWRDEADLRRLPEGAVLLAAEAAAGVGEADLRRLPEGARLLALNAQRPTPDAQSPNTQESGEWRVGSGESRFPNLLISQSPNLPISQSPNTQLPALPSGDAPSPNWILIGALGTLMAFGGFALGAVAYRGRKFAFARVGASGALPLAVYHSSFRKLYWDEFYWAVLVRPLFVVTAAARALDQWGVDGLVNAAGWSTRGLAWVSRQMDVYLVDGTVNFSGWICGRFGQALRLLQTGQTQTYVLIVFIGVLLVIAALVPLR